MNETQFSPQPLVTTDFASVVAVVLNWSAEELTSECIDSLECSQYSRLRILLIDNGSPDGSGERLHARFPTEVPPVAVPLPMLDPEPSVVPGVGAS